MFQSLIGFKINWNSIESIESKALNTFQSLIGFKINWNPIFLWLRWRCVGVSIPNRV
ncbi:hypothetical protein C789_1569 [Microcystis aeruginosa FACHB-905 = DIANCHI905]|nr:hypothetical protein C789_1569 [Microcystis aeruginosa FACHB-905 = DIANCHI905]